MIYYGQIQRLTLMAGVTIFKEELAIIMEGMLLILFWPKINSISSVAHIRSWRMDMSLGMIKNLLLSFQRLIIVGNLPIWQQC